MVGARTETDRPRVERARHRHQRTMSRRRHREVVPGGGRERSGRREEVGQLAVRRAERAERRHGPGGERACADHGHLLAEDRRSGGELGPVDMTRRAQTGPPGHEPRQVRVAAQAVVDGTGVGVEVEQPPAPIHRCGQVADVFERQPTRHVSVASRQADRPGAERQPRGPPVRLAVPRLHTGHRPQAENPNTSPTANGPRWARRSTAPALLRECHVWNDVEPQRATPWMSRRTPPAPRR
ncbi:MAG: hypothetical protein R2705_16735 [Ilumatobacteraceae bacterium]